METRNGKSMECNVGMAPRKIVLGRIGRGCGSCAT
jgi:hypothetical protein